MNKVCVFCDWISALLGCQRQVDAEKEVERVYTEKYKDMKEEIDTVSANIAQSAHESQRVATALNVQSLALEALARDISR